MQRDDAFFAGEGGYFFSCEWQQWYKLEQGAHVDGDNGTELERLRRGKESMEALIPECVCKQGEGQRKQLHCVGGKGAWRWAAKAERMPPALFLFGFEKSVIFPTFCK